MFHHSPQSYGQIALLLVVPSCWLRGRCNAIVRLLLYQSWWSLWRRRSFEDRKWISVNMAFHAQTLNSILKLNVYCYSLKNVPINLLLILIFFFKQILIRMLSRVKVRFYVWYETFTPIKSIIIICYRKQKLSNLYYSFFNFFIGTVSIRRVKYSYY